MEDIENIVDSIQNQKECEAEILLVSDRSDDYRTNDPNVKVIKLPKKIGASYARNIGARIAKGDVLAFLDDDVVLDPDWSKYVLQTFDDPSIGGVSGKSIVSDKSLDWVPVPFKWVIGGCWWDENEISEVFGAAGMNFSIRKTLFDEVGGYDEGLGPRSDRPETKSWRRLGAEESDLALRIMSLARKRVVYNPKAKVTHRVRRSSILPLGLLRRSLHVGHNRAYIARRYSFEGSDQSDLNVGRSLPKQFLLMAFYFPTHPIRSWKQFSLSLLVLSGSIIGYAIGRLEFRSYPTTRIELVPRPSE